MNDGFKRRGPGANDALIPPMGPRMAAARAAAAKHLQQEHNLVEEAVAAAKIARSAVNTGHIEYGANPALMPPNGTFEHAVRDLATSPPDCWSVATGSTWGASGDVFHETDASFNRTLVLRPTANIARVQSAVFPVVPSSDYSIDLRYKTADGGVVGFGAGFTNLLVVVEFFKDSDAATASTILASRTHTVGTGFTGTWLTDNFRAQAVPSDANFCRIRLEKSAADADLTVYIGDISFTRFDIDQPGFTDVLPAGAGDGRFQNGWTNRGFGYEEAGYHRDSLSNVTLCGSISGGTIGLTAFTLPSGYRPAATRSFGVNSNGAHGAVEVSSAGAVTPVAGDVSHLSLDGISFRTA